MAQYSFWREKWRLISEGLFRDTPPFFLVIGLCPALAVTTAAINGVIMGIAVTFVLMGAEVIISLLRKWIPRTIRIPVYVIIIAVLVTVIDLVLAGTVPAIHRVLGIFVPLIVVNCTILGRVEAFAAHNTPANAAADALGYGLGYMWALVAIGSVREILGNGTWFGLQIFPEGLPTVDLFKLAPGAFVTMAAVLAALNVIRRRRAPTSEKNAAIPVVSRNAAA
ncbi:MAG: electron transport complex subunit RsxE [Limnochorda sp.]|uniref:electron transport complex subunit RsxE n=1 Tax=Limnochorda sp. TaxID=1940279 RepID=UPI0039C22CEE